jgi:glycine/D-amino acid oxidase-like deaminating enzyme
MPKPPNIDDLKLTPYWWESAPRPVTERVDIPKVADVGIVGAGYAGITAALILARAGRSVVVFDAMRAGEGASSRNGGICSGNIKFNFPSMIEKYGLDRAKTFYAEGVAARTALIQMIEEENIDCYFQSVGRFDGANHARDYDAMGRETDLLNKHLDFGAYMVAKSDQRAELGTDFYKGGRVRPDVGGVHPAELHQGLYERALTAGVTVIDLTAVTAISRNTDGFTLNTARGLVKTGECIVATNGYTDQVTDWLRRRIIPIPSQIIATDTLDPELLNQLMPKRRMVGDTRNLYNYYRPSPDGTRIIFGGRRGADTDDDMQKCMHLYNNLVEVFPELEGVRLTHTWWGYTGYTFDFIPHLMVHDGIHYATGFCGSGVVWAPWLGSKAAHLILGNQQDAQSIFLQTPFPTRPFYNGNPWFIPYVIRWYGLKDRFMYGRKH